MPLEAVACTSCGSPEVSEYKPGSYVCGHCDTVFRHVDPSRFTVTQAPQVCDCGHQADGQCTDCGRWVCNRHRGRYDVDYWWRPAAEGYAVDGLQPTSTPRPHILPSDLPLSFDLSLSHDLHSESKGADDRVICGDCGAAWARGRIHVALEQRVTVAAPPWPSHWWDQANARVRDHLDRTSPELQAFREDLSKTVSSFQTADIVNEWLRRGGAQTPMEKIEIIAKPATYSENAVYETIGHGHRFKDVRKPALMGLHAWVYNGQLCGTSGLRPLDASEIWPLTLVRAMHERLSGYRLHAA
jgi:hypothetical protein